MSQAEPTTVQKKGVITKCPSCGAAVAAFASLCEACGHEFAEIDANRTIRALVARLEEVERDVERSGLGLSRRKSETLERRSRVIRDFPIPNAREDLQQLIHFIHPKTVDGVKPDANIEDWRAKFAEVMSRAKAAYRGDASVLAEFERLENDLATGLSDDLKAKARRNPVFVILLALVVLAGLGMVVRSQLAQAKLARCEADYATHAQAERQRLDAAYASATQLLQGGRFTEAMAAANQLRWEQQASECRQQENEQAGATWGEKRKQLISLVQQGADAASAEKKAREEQQTAQVVAEQERVAEVARVSAAKEREAAARAEAARQAAAAQAATQQRREKADKLF